MEVLGVFLDKLENGFIDDGLEKESGAKIQYYF